MKKREPAVILKTWIEVSRRFPTVSLVIVSPDASKGKQQEALLILITLYYWTPSWAQLHLTATPRVHASQSNAALHVREVNLISSWAAPPGGRAVNSFIHSVQTSGLTVCAALADVLASLFFIYLFFLPQSFTPAAVFSPAFFAWEAWSQFEVQRRGAPVKAERDKRWRKGLFFLMSCCNLIQKYLQHSLFTF